MNAVRNTVRRPMTLAALAGAAAALAVPTAADSRTGPVVVTSPKSGSTIDGSRVTLRIKTGKFKVTSQATGVRRNEGHFHVFLDKRPFVAVYSSRFRFRGLKPGSHTLKVQPVDSAHVPAKGYKAIVVKFRTT